MGEHPSHPAKCTASPWAELIRGTQEMVADRLPDNAASLQGGNLYVPVGIPAADNHVSVRDLSREPELSIQKHLELIPFLDPAVVSAGLPPYAHIPILTGISMLAKVDPFVKTIFWPQ